MVRAAALDLCSNCTLHATPLRRIALGYVVCHSYFTPSSVHRYVAALPYVVVNNQTAMTTQLARQIKRALVVDTNPTAFAKHLSEDKGEALTTLQV